jgi:membrane fusion protein, multidrug efflux system
MKTHLYRIVVLAAAVLTYSACGKTDDQSANATNSGAGNRGSQAAAPALLVTTEQAGMVQWQDQIEAIGTTAANESITISAKVTETVARINFQDGEKVRAGDVLVELTGRAEVAALREAQAAFQDAERQRERLSAIVKQGTVTQAQLDQQTAQRDQANARREAIRARLSDRVILAPFSGLVGFRMISPGALVTPGTAITTLDDVSTIKLDFTVPENQLSTVHIGDKVTAKSSAFANQVFEGEVVSIDSRIDPATRAIKVRARIGNEDMTLRSGMLMNVSLKTQTRQALGISEIAIQQQAAQAFVYRLSAQKTAERTDVKIGARRDGLVEIKEGLNEGDQIVTDGAARLRAGAVVQIATPSTATPTNRSSNP